MIKKLALLLLAFCSVCAAQQCQTIINGSVTIMSSGQGAVTLCGASTSSVLTAIAVSPGIASVLQGQPVSYTATGTFADGSTADVTLQSLWASSNTSVATVGSSANPQPITCGASASATVTITATIASIIGTATLTCNPPPTISPSSLPGGIVGTPYSAPLTATGGTPPYQWTVPAGPIPNGAVDFMDYGLMSLPDRNSFHLNGTAVKYFHLDAGLLEWEKGASGFPWDGEMYDANHIYQWFTEGDSTDNATCIANGFSSCFNDPNANKTYINPVALWPRYFVPGTDIVTYTPGPNKYIQTANCGADAQAPIDNLGVRGELTGPFTNVQWSTTFGGSIPDNTPYLLAQKWTKCTANNINNCLNEEDYWLVLHWGQVEWCPKTFNGTIYVTGTCSVNTTKTSGGPGTLNFGCGVPNIPALGVLPPGTIQTSSPSLNLDNAGGTISGTPSTAGTYNFTVQAEDSLGHIGQQNYSVPVAASSSRTPLLPQSWVNEQESILGSYTQTLTIPVSAGIFNGPAVPTWNCHGTSHGGIGGYNSSNGAGGLTTFLGDVEKCRASFGDSFRLVMTPGTVLTITNSSDTTAGPHGFYLWQSSVSPVDTSSSPIVFDSSVPIPLGTNLDANGVAVQARVGTYAISQTNGIVCSSTFCTVTIPVAMAAVPGVGDLATIWQPDNRAYAGQYSICNHTTAGCSDPTLTTFMYPWTGAAGTTQNGTVWAIQKQNPITSMSSSGCSAALAQCTVTVNFASNPGLSVGDRFQIVGASPDTFNTTWHVASTGTNSITFFSYTEYIGNISASTPGVLLHKNHILSDQHDCCMYTLELAGGSGPLVMADPQAHNYAFYNGEARVQSGTNGETFILITFGNFKTYESPQTPQQLNFSGCNGLIAQPNCDEAVHVGLDRMYVHGYSFPAVTNTQAEIRKAVLLECGFCYFTNSYAEDINSSNSDSNIVATTYGTGPTKIVNNYLEGATEQIMIGYYAACQKVLSPFQQVADVEIRRNWITRNPFQTMNAAVLIPGLATKYLNYIIKNDVECKACKRFLVDGNIVEESAGAAGQQNGTLLSVNDQSAASCSAGSVGNQGSIVAEGTYTNNILRHALAGGYQTSSTSPSTSPSIMEKTGTLMYFNNLGYDLGDNTHYGRPGWGGTSWSGFGFSQVFQFGTRGWSFPPFTKLTVTSVAAASGGSTVYTGTITNGAGNTYAGQPVIISGFTNAANNGTFTASASTATALTLANASGVAETKNASALMQGCTGSAAVSGGGKIATLNCPNYSQGVPNALQPGMGMHVGDWIEVQNCVDTNYNVSAPQEVPITSESFLNFTVSYPVPSAAGASPGGGCKVNNQYGYARFLTFSHNTMLYDGSITNSFYNNVQMAGGEQYLWTSQSGNFQLRRDTWIQNNLVSYKQTPFIVAGVSSPQIMHCAGTSSSNSHGETICYDTNTFVWNHNVMSGGGDRTKYTEWNAPNGVAGANNGATPPVTDVFLANGTPGDACANILSPTSTCFGFVGNYASTNQAPDFAPSPLDYHKFALVSNSNWAATMAGQASDGTNTGVDMNALDRALTLGQYVCQTTCGTGPLP